MDEEEQKAAEEAAAREAAEAAAAEAAKAAKSGSGNSGDSAEAAVAEATAELERVKAELEAAKAEAARFKGIDPEVAKANAKKIAEAEAASRDAEKRAAEAEGNFEKLRKIQKEEDDAALEAERAARTAAEERAARAEAALNAATVSTAFATATFISKETILSPAKAERLYSDHVEIEDGKPVVYDAPRGAAKRAKVMDSKGNALPFNDAIKKVVEADPDKDTILKSKIAPGANSKTVEAKSREEVIGNRQAKLAKGLAKLRGA